MPKKRYTARIYIGEGRYQWVGRYETRRERDRAKAEALVSQEAAKRHRMTVQDFADRFLEDYERDHKPSSVDTARQSLKPFLKAFGRRDLDTITRTEAKDWARQAKAGWVPVVVTLFNVAVEDDLLEKNPFRGLARRSKGRGDQDPPTDAEVAQILEACDVLGAYGSSFRAFVTFAMYTGMRPGELYALEWGDVDMDRMRIHVNRRLYRGSTDLPKSGEARVIALTPPARDALLTLPREDRLVFLTKTGRRMSQTMLSNYWRLVLAKAGLEFDFYLASRHFCAHYMWTKLGLPERVVIAQLGHVDATLLRRVYGHGNVGALEEIDRAFETAEVRQLRPVRDADETQAG